MPVGQVPRNMPRGPQQTYIRRVAIRPTTEIKPQTAVMIKENMPLSIGRKIVKNGLGKIGNVQKTRIPPKSLQTAYRLVRYGVSPYSIVKGTFALTRIAQDKEYPKSLKLMYEISSKIAKNNLQAGSSRFTRNAFLENVPGTMEDYNLKGKRLIEGLEVANKMASNKVHPGQFIVNFASFNAGYSVGAEQNKKYVGKILKLSNRLAERGISPEDTIRYFENNLKITKSMLTPKQWNKSMTTIDTLINNKIDPAGFLEGLYKLYPLWNKQVEIVPGSVNKTLEIAEDLASKKVNPDNLMREVETIVDVFGKKRFGDALKKIAELNERLEKKQLPPYFLMHIIPEVAKKSRTRLIEEMEKLEKIYEKIGAENGYVFLGLRKNYNISMLETFAEHFKSNELHAININKLMELNGKRTESFAKIVSHPYMQRSRDRLLRFVQAIALSEKGGTIVLDFATGKELGKKQVGELPYLAQYVATYERLSENIPKLEGETVKEAAAKVRSEVASIGKKRYGEGFERKMDELIEKNRLSELFTVITATSSLEKHYSDRRYESEKRILNDMMKLWLTDKGIEEYKFRELADIGVPRAVAEKWKSKTAVEAETKQEEISVSELAQRMREAFDGLNFQRQEEFRKDYEEAISAVETTNYQAQKKVQKLMEQMKKVDSVAADHLGWVEGQLIRMYAPAASVEITDEVRFPEWLNAGEKFGTCQSWSSNGEFNRALVSFLADSNKKIVGMYDRQTGDMRGRGILYLTKSGRQWGLYLDDIYVNASDSRDIIEKYAKEKAKLLGVPLVGKPGELIGKAPYTYVNSYGGLVRQKVVKS
jgi:hypothetical protein